MREETGRSEGSRIAALLQPFDHEALYFKGVAAGRHPKCGRCGDAIPRRRLRALPFAVDCERCAAVLAECA